MQIEIYNPAHGQPLPPVEWNYDDVKKWVQDGLSAYKGRVYTEDAITDAKKDRASLNKLADAIDTKRKEMKSTYLRPYESFEAQAKELTSMIKDTVSEIDAQVKAYENFRKEQKLEKIKTELYAPMIGNLAALVPYERLHNPKWLNATTSVSAISDELARKIDKIVSGLSSIDSLSLAPDIAEQVKGRFLNDFDLAAALAEKERIERQREQLARYEADRQAATDAQRKDINADDKYTPIGTDMQAATRYSDDNTAEKIHTITFRIRVTESNLRLLGDFMRANGIRPERV